MLEDARVKTRLRALLDDAGHRSVVLDDRDALLDTLEGGWFHAVVGNDDMLGAGALDWADAHPIVLAHRPCVDTALRVTRMGGDYLTLPLNPSALLRAVSRLVHRQQRRLESSNERGAGARADLPRLAVAWHR